MATSQRPEATNNQSEPTQDQNQNQALSEQVPTNENQPRTYTEDEVRAIHNLYGLTLQENERRINDLMQNQNQPQNVNAPQQSNSQNDDFLSNGRNIVAEEIEKRLAPFSTFVQQQQAQTVYGQLKEAFKKHPQYAAFFNIPNAEVILDQQVLQMPPQNVNINSIAALISQIYGYMTFNNLIPQNNNQQQQVPQLQQQQYNTQIQNQPVNNQQNLPPHLRPSAPPMPNNGSVNSTPKGNPRRQLTELERRVARERGMSDDDYIDFLHEDATQVYRSDIGRPQGGNQ